MKTKFTRLNIGVLFIGLMAFGTLTQCKPIQTQEESFNGYRVYLKDINTLRQARNVGFFYKGIFDGKNAYYLSHVGQDFTATFSLIINPLNTYTPSELEYLERHYTLPFNMFAYFGEDISFEFKLFQDGEPLVFQEGESINTITSPAEYRISFNMKNIEAIEPMNVDEIFIQILPVDTRKKE